MNSHPYLSATAIAAMMIMVTAAVYDGTGSVLGAVLVVWLLLWLLLAILFDTIRENEMWQRHYYGDDDYGDDD